MPRASESPLLAGVLLMLSAGVLPAAELVVRDLGAELESPPSGLAFTVTDDAGSRSGSDTLDHPLGLVLGGRYSLAGTGAAQGVVLGGGLAIDRGGFGSGSWSSSELRGSAGWGWAASDRLFLVGEAVVGLGREQLDVGGGSRFASQSFSGPAISAGAQVVGLYALSESVILTGDLGWRRTSVRMTSDDVDLDLIRSGFAVALGVSWRFSNRPFLLE